MKEKIKHMKEIDVWDILDYIDNSVVTRPLLRKFIESQYGYASSSAEEMVAKLNKFKIYINNDGILKTRVSKKCIS